jgi:hypothetical protein
MTKDEEILATIISERGFVVGATRRKRRIGECIREVKKVRDEEVVGVVATAQPFYVIGEATMEDFLEQQRIMQRYGVANEDVQEGEHLYRIATD